MAWRLVKVETADALESDLTNSEMVGVSIILIHHAGEPLDDMNVYYRAWRKIQPMVDEAIDGQANDDS
jgi:hypothetical protein